jgi:hypothetical protein
LIVQPGPPGREHVGRRGASFAAGKARALANRPQPKHEMGNQTLKNKVATANG